MDLVKKNWLSITFGVIAALAVCADFWPMGGKYAALRSEAQARAKVNSELQSLETKQRNKPQIDPERAEPEPLGVFPTPAIIKAGGEATQKLAEGAKQLEAEVIKLNIHTPLVAGALPGRAEDHSPLIDFARAYVEAFNVMGTQPQREQSVPWRAMKFGMPPTDQDIQHAKDQLKFDTTNELKTVDVSGNISNQREIDQEVATQQAALPEKMRGEVAAKSFVYIQPDGSTFTLFNPPITVGQAPDPSIIFAAQIGLWVQEDFCKAIYAINTMKGSDGNAPKNVTEAPIKRLIKITVPSPPAQLPMPFLGVTTSADPNAAAAASGEPKPNTVLSPTGRVSNAMYDVVQFEVDMDVEADKLPMILEELGRGQFLSVVQVVSITAIDSSIWHAAGFYFGNKPIVNVKLKCEDLFMREWTKKLMPPVIRQKLGVPADTPAT
jgi:hypothetical protein